MKKYIGVGLLLLAVVCAQPNEMLAACNATLTLDLEKQSRDHFTDGQVSVLQNFLKNQGFLQSDVTGFFGNDTYAAVRGYQAAHNISPVSGFVGALTRASINATPCLSSEVSAIDTIIQANQGAVLGMSTTDSHVAAAPKSTVAVTSPNGGEKYTAGESISIRIKSKRYYSDDVVSLYVVPVKGSEGESYTLKEKLVGNSFKWKIPETVISGEYVVRAQLLSCYGGSDTCSLVGDDSDDSIYIQGVDSSPSTGTFNKDLSLGSTGSDVVKLQQMLVANGYLVMEPGSAMGYFGSRTQTAVARWQAANGISPADGYFGAVSRARANQVFCVGNCNQSLVINVSTPTSGATYGFDDDVTLNWTPSNSNFDYYNIHLGVFPDDDVHVIYQKMKKTSTSFSISSEKLLQIAEDVFDVDYTYSDKYGVDFLKNVYFRVEAVRGIPNGEMSLAIGQSGYFNLLTEGDDETLTASSMELLNIQKTYQANGLLGYQIKGISSDGQIATPEKGFAVGIYVHELDNRGNDVDTVSSMFATYDYSKKVWGFKMAAPSNVNKKYSATTLFYCANPKLGCSSGEVKERRVFGIVNSLETPSITIGYPNGGEVFGNDNSINEDVSIGVGFLAKNLTQTPVRIDLVNQDGKYVARTKMLEINTNGKNAHTISIPRDSNTKVFDGKYKISVCTTANANAEVCDMSDGYFTIKRNSTTGTPAVVTSMKLSGLNKTYSVSDPVTYGIVGMLSDGNIAKPDRGYAARAAIEEYEARGNQWFTSTSLSTKMYDVGVWNGRDRWDIKMVAPSDTSKTYRVRTIVYCADKTLGCVTGADSFAVSHEPIAVKDVVNPPTTPTTPTTPSIDAQARTILYNIKSVADKYYVKNNNSYWGSVAGQDVCDVTGEYTVGAYMEEIAQLGGWSHEKNDHSNEANSTPSRVRVWCHVSAQEWAIVVPLKDSPGAFQCVDSRGARTVVDKLPADQNYCPEDRRG